MIRGGSMMREKVSTIVFSSISELSETDENKIPLDLKENIPLYGENGVLDSLGLVTLIVMIEGEIENKMEEYLIIADEKAMSQQTSPFLTAGTLIEYICRLINKESDVWINQ